MDKRRKKTVSDSVCEVHKFSGYAVLSNCFVRSTNLGWSAIGLLARVLDLPPTWNFSKAGLVAICPDGETAIDTALKELEEWGYLERKTEMPDESPNGRIRTVYAFYEYSEKDNSIPQYDCEMETFTVDNATLNRVKKDGNYTMVSRKLLRDTELRNKLLGFLLKVRSLPNYWNFSMPGLTAICKEGKTAVHNAVGKLIEMGYLVRTKLLSNESINNGFEYVYSFYDVPVSKDKADEIEMETRRKAITVRSESVEKSVDSSSVIPEKQEAENLYMDNPSADIPTAENQVQYNKQNTIQKNLLFNHQSSIISGEKPQVFNSDKRTTDGFNAEERKVYTEIVRENIGYFNLGDWLTKDGRDGFKEADDIVSYIVEEICSPTPYSMIRNTSFPRSIVKSTMLKANINMVENVLIKMSYVDGIKDYRRYFISALYNEVLTYHFNEGCENRWAAHAVARDFGYSA